MPKRGKLELRCHDNSTVSGAATRLRWLWEKARRLEGGVEEDGVALVRVSSALPYHMGRYICVNDVTREHSSIFVYVKGGFSEVRRTRRRQCGLTLLWKNQKSVQSIRCCVFQSSLKVQIQQIMKWSVKNQKDELAMVCFKEKEK